MNLRICALSCLLAVLVLGAGCEDNTHSTASLDTPLVINRGNGGEPGSLDPALAEDIHAFNILTDLYEGLIAESASGELVPGVAESWAISDDGLVYEFSLRENARWSNGDTVTSEDFVRAFRRVANPATASAYGSLLEPIQNFSTVLNGQLPPEQLGVSALGEFSLAIRLREPTPHFPALLAMPIAFPVHESAAASGTFSDPKQFVSNGAYTLAAYSPGAPTTLRANPMYWDAASVAVDEIVYFPIVNPLTEFNMYRAGEIDITHNIPSEHLRSLKETVPDQIRIAPFLALYYLALDLTEPPLDDNRLRKALSMAIDREKLVDLVGRGEQAAYGIVPGGIAGYAGASFSWRNLPDEERHRRARQLYNDAGYSNESPLTLSYLYDTEDIHEKVALAISSMWRTVLGINVVLEKREWQYFLDTRDQRNDWQVMRFAWFGDYNHASTFTNIFRSDDPQNLSGYRNAQYDKLLTASVSEHDGSEQGKLLTQAETILLEDNPIAPLYFFVSKHLVRPGISGFEDNVLDRHPSRYLAMSGEK